MVTDVAQLSFSRPAQMAASVVVGLMCWSVSFVFNQQDMSPASSQLPAQSAFSKGIIAMDNGDTEQAVDWFKFALNENPDSIESSLFLAETLLRQNKADESFDYLKTLLQKPNLDDYNKMTATNLLSRIRQRQGQLRDVLRYAEAST